MTQDQLNQLGKTLWAIADQLRGAMNAGSLTFGVGSVSDTIDTCCRLMHTQRA